MNEHLDEPRHPVGPEIDDSGNPTAASPEDDQTARGGSFPNDTGGAGGSGWGGDQADYVPPDEGASQASGRRPAAGREMLTQLQQMIDTLTVQATPVVREIAAKAAELAAVAGEKAGPLAHRAAEATEKVGGRVAVRSKEMAAELRSAQAAEAPASTDTAAPVENEEAGG